jgi:hypothetical protein
MVAFPMMSLAAELPRKDHGQRRPNIESGWSMNEADDHGNEESELDDEKVEHELPKAYEDDFDDEDFDDDFDEDFEEELADEYETDQVGFSEDDLMKPKNDVLPEDEFGDDEAL